MGAGEDQWGLPPVRFVHGCHVDDPREVLAGLGRELQDRGALNGLHICRRWQRRRTREGIFPGCLGAATPRTHLRSQSGLSGLGATAPPIATSSVSSIAGAVQVVAYPFESARSASLVSRFWESGAVVIARSGLRLTTTGRDHGRSLVVQRRGWRALASSRIFASPARRSSSRSRRSTSS